MTKSIEMLWKDGFVKEADLNAPKINDLYNRKSQNTVDKLINTFDLNIKWIVGGSLIMLIMMTLIGAPLLGLYICCLLAPLVFIAKKELNKSINLSKGQNSYDYLTNFDRWLKSSIKVYSRYYQYFYPLLFIGMATQAIMSKAGGKIIALLLEVFPTELVLLSLPYYLLVLVVGVTLLLWKYAQALYQLDLNIVYGRQFEKLEELLNDMRALKTSQ